MGGLADNFAVLIAARVLQGVGAGGLMALSEVKKALVEHRLTFNFLCSR